MGALPVLFFCLSWRTPNKCLKSSRDHSRSRCCFSFIFQWTKLMNLLQEMFCAMSPLNSPRRSDKLYTKRFKFEKKISMNLFIRSLKTRFSSCSSYMFFENLACVQHVPRSSQVQTKRRPPISVWCYSIERWSWKLLRDSQLDLQCILCLSFSAVKFEERSTGQQWDIEAGKPNTPLEDRTTCFVSELGLRHCGCNHTAESNRSIQINLLPSFSWIFGPSCPPKKNNKKQLVQSTPHATPAAAASNAIKHHQSEAAAAAETAAATKKRLRPRIARFSANASHLSLVDNIYIGWHDLLHPHFFSINSSNLVNTTKFQLCVSANGCEHTAAASSTGKNSNVWLFRI